MEAAFSLNAGWARQRILSRGVGIVSAECYLLRHILFGYVVIFLMMIIKEIIGLFKKQQHWGIAGLMSKLNF